MLRLMIHFEFKDQSKGLSPVSNKAKMSKTVDHQQSPLLPISDTTQCKQLVNVLAFISRAPVAPTISLLVELYSQTGSLNASSIFRVDFVLYLSHSNKRTTQYSFFLHYITFNCVFLLFLF